MRPLLGAVAALLLFACATRSPAVRARDVADEAFSRGDHVQAEGAYRAAEAEAVDADERERARLHALLARSAAAGAEGRDAALAELRTYAVSAAGTSWGRLATLFTDEMAQADALRWALQRAGADIARLEERVATLEEEVAQGQRSHAELAQVQATLREERAQLQRAHRELEELLAVRAARIAELEAELEALKSIDMSRTP